MIVFLPISLNMCFGCSKELSHRDGSFEYPQHVLVEKKENYFSGTHSYLGACNMVWEEMLFEEFHD